MAWIRRHLTREGVVTTSDAWLVHRLTGAFVTDAATAGRTQLLDLDRVVWSPAGPGHLRPDRRAAARGRRLRTATVGTTTAFGGEIPLTGLLVDQQAALLAQSVTEPGTAKCTYGTGAFLLAQTGPRPRRGASGLVSCVAWRLGGRTSYCLDGQVYTAASAVRWLTDLGRDRGRRRTSTRSAAPCRTPAESPSYRRSPDSPPPGGAATCAAR